MTDNFVGFARSPKQSKTATLQTLQSSIRLGIPLAEAVQLISSAEGAERWIGELLTPKAKWRFQLGAKLRFKDEIGEFGATFGAINLPQQVIVLTERFGEVTLGFGVASSKKRWFKRSSDVAVDASGAVDVLVARMCEPDEVIEWESASHELLTRLSSIVNPGTEVRYSSE